jgi:CRP-like cAMP-binding protein
MPTIEELKDDALAALVEGEYDKALGYLDALEGLQPEAGGWPHKRGELLLRLGRTGPAVEALARAADRYARAGQGSKAIAVSKAIVRAEPEHAVLQAPAGEAFAASNHVAGMPTSGHESFQGTVTEGGQPASEPALDVEVAVSQPGEGPPLELDVLEAGSDFADDAPSAVHAMSTAARMALRTLPKIPLFSSLKAQQIRRLIQGVELRRAPAGEVIVRQGEPGEELFVVASGKVVVMAPDEIARLGEGSFFGEIALLTERGRTATVRACTNTDLLTLPRSLFLWLLQQSPEALKLVRRYIRDRLVGRLLETSPLFATFSDSDRQELIGRFRFLELGERTEVLQQGRHAAAFFILLAGEAVVVRDGQPVATLGDGEVFGERSLLTGRPATESVRISTRSFALELPSQQFRPLVLHHRALLDCLRRLSQERPAGWVTPEGARR